MRQVWPSQTIAAMRGAVSVERNPLSEFAVEVNGPAQPQLWRFLGWQQQRRCILFLAVLVRNCPQLRIYGAHLPHVRRRCVMVYSLQTCVKIVSFADATAAAATANFRRGGVPVPLARQPTSRPAGAERPASASIACRRTIRCELEPAAARQIRRAAADCSRQLRQLGRRAPEFFVLKRAGAPAVQVGNLPSWNRPDQTITFVSPSLETCAVAGQSVYVSNFTLSPSDLVRRRTAR